MLGVSLEVSTLSLKLGQKIPALPGIMTLAVARPEPQVSGDETLRLVTACPERDAKLLSER